MLARVTVMSRTLASGSFTMVRMSLMSYTTDRLHVLADPQDSVVVARSRIVRLHYVEDVLPRTALVEEDRNDPVAFWSHQQALVATGVVRPYDIRIVTAPELRARLCRSQTSRRALVRV